MIVKHSSKELFEKIFKFESEHFLWPWKLNDWLSLDLSRYLLIVDDPDGPKSFALLDTISESAHLLKILVDPSLRGGEASSFMMDGIKSCLKDNRYTAIYLEVAETNHRAIGFYKKHGFVAIRRISNFYTNGDAAVAMECLLN